MLQSIVRVLFKRKKAVCGGLFSRRQGEKDMAAESRHGGGNRRFG